MTVRIDEKVSADRLRGDAPTGAVPEPRWRLIGRAAARRHRLAWLSHLHWALPRSRA